MMVILCSKLLLVPRGCIVQYTVISTQGFDSVMVVLYSIMLLVQRG